MMMLHIQYCPHPLGPRMPSSPAWEVDLSDLYPINGPIWRVFFFGGLIFCNWNPTSPPTSPHIPTRFLCFFPSIFLVSFILEIYQLMKGQVGRTLWFWGFPSRCWTAPHLGTENIYMEKSLTTQSLPKPSHAASQSWPKWLCIPNEKNKNLKTLPAEVGHTDWTQVGPKKSLKFGGF